MAMGELFLSAFFQVLFDRLASHELMDFARQLQGGVLFLELEKLEKTLRMIQGLLRDAEEKQLTKNIVKTWLDDLQDLAYDVEDILDEFAYEALHHKLVAKHHTATAAKVLTLLPSCFTSLPFNVRIGSKIKEITSLLEAFYDQRSALGLQVLSGGTSNAALERPPSTGMRTEPAVYGREDDIKNVLDIVLSNEVQSTDANFHVISIVGTGGIGKTTLVREVYHSEKVVQDFEPTAWVCVSENFDLLRISKAILESITHSTCGLNELNEVQVRLKEAVDGKKFLFVLDDVWNKDYDLWVKLRSPFLGGASGSKIIVTAREADVAVMMGAIKYNLKLLSDVDCWFVFIKHAFDRDSDADQISESVREKTIEKCGGLPLAAMALGGIIRTKRRDDGKIDDAIWKEILESKFWDLPPENGILPVLKLSYHHLRSHLKRCFTYCAIFPKDYEFEEKELIFLWMAEGLIQSTTNNKRLEDLGSEYIHDLVSSSIFQKLNNKSSKFIMHDLVHDLAQLVSGDTSFRLEEANKKSIKFNKVRHASYIGGNYDENNKFEVFHKFEHLRTFLPLPIHRHGAHYELYVSHMVLSDLLPKLKKLRVLSLRRYYITQLPDSIGEMTHLRYLNLSTTMIRILPESTSLLFNLQSLLLKDCCRLTKLPSKMKNLINLRHLDISGKNLLQQMPLGMIELKDLQILSNFIVGKGNGSSLDDLKNLKFLQGELCISGLENVPDPKARKQKILCHHKDLEVLSLCWQSQFDDSRNEVKEENVLDMLHPHINLKELTINCYGGTRIPSWLGDPSFCKMVTLNLENCNKCKVLPSLGMLGSLKNLSITGMAGLKRLGFEIYGEDCLKPFQSLETLCFENLQEWEFWEPIKENELVENFPCLRELSIVRCPKLTGKLPNYLPSLETLIISKCAELVILLSSFPVLCELVISECKGIVCNGNPTDFNSLNFMALSKVAEFGNLSKQGFHNVEFLKIVDSEELISSWQTMTYTVEKPSQGMHSLTSLKGLHIENCPSLDLFPEADFLPNLSYLEIVNCKALKSLPERIKHYNASLQCLKIDGCDSLTFIVRGMLSLSLKRIEIRNCGMLQCLVDDRDYASNPSSSSNTCLSLLEHLEIINCSSLTCISTRGQLPISLKYLEIYECSNLDSIAERFDNSMCLREIRLYGCQNLKSIPDGLHHLNNLDLIFIFHCPSIVSFPENGLPNSRLRLFFICICMENQSLPNCLHNINSLQELTITQCPNIILFPEEGLPTNLTSLTIDGDLKIYKPLIQWGLHNLTSLRSLQISRCSDAVSFPQEEMEMILPTSLIHLSLTSFPKLRYLSSIGFQSLTSLKYLWIIHCLKLKSFPEVGLPSSVLQVCITSCPLLKKRCKRDKGKEWWKIAHIPCVKIDDKFIYDSEGEESMILHQTRVSENFFIPSQ